MHCETNPSLWGGFIALGFIALRQRVWRDTGPWLAVAAPLQGWDGPTALRTLPMKPSSLQLPSSCI